MTDLLACRVCLASNNSKLYSFFNFKLAQNYENLTGTKPAIGDGLPFYMCSYCSAMLLKMVAFKEKCCNTQSLLKYCLDEQSELSLEYLRSLTREVGGLSLPYSVTNTMPLVTINYDADDDDDGIKVENDLEDYKDLQLDDLDNIKSEQEDKPADKPRRPRRRKRKRDYLVTVKTEDLEETVVDSIHQPLDQTLEQTLDQTLDQNLEQSLEPEDEDAAMSGLKDVEVVTLTRQQQFQEIEARKTSWNYINSAYKCDKCYKGFMMDTTYGNHMERHDPKRGEFECDVCFSRWAEPRSLRAHVNNAHRRKYICKLCDFVSRSSYRAKEHCLMHNGYQFVCKICGATFAKSTSQLTHLRLQHPSAHACELCGESFVGDFGLAMHKKRAHRHRDFQCQCSAEFQTVEALKTHLQGAADGHCDPELRPCARCGRGFPSDEELAEHMKEHQGRFVCEHCFRGFSSEKSLAVHQQRVHLGVKPRPRKPPHAPPRRADSVVCEICGKTCITNATLRYHRRIHTGEKPFQCSECPKKFTVHQRLQIHFRTHSGERPYKCKHCPKAFKHKAALNRHDRVHTGVKPYVCAHCGKAFSQSNSMKLHVNTVHLKMPAPYRSRRNKQ